MGVFWLVRVFCDLVFYCVCVCVVCDWFGFSVGLVCWLLLGFLFDLVLPLRKT